MFDFAHPSLLWGLALAGVPVLIHLINLLRHRRVQWAAMEFLLQSVKKNTHWIRFKELLLLLLRVAAILAIVSMLARPRLRSEFGRLIGEGRTHHIVVLDDSFSMADAPPGGESCFDRAKRAIQRLGEHAQGEPTAQAFTLVRFSQCGRDGRANDYDYHEAQVDSQFAGDLEETLRPLAPSESAAGPGRALEAIENTIGASDDAERVLYLLSDFRSKDWAEPGELTSTLDALHRAGVGLHLLDCADKPRGNLAIVSLKQVGGARAAGVPLVMEATVKNFGANRETNVAVLLSQDGESLPPLVFDSIAPGAAESRRFQAAFDAAGLHGLSARLEAERAGVGADNVRYLSLHLPIAAPVLLIDGDPKGGDARFLTRAMSPRGVVKTGLAPRTEPPEFLNSNALDSFSTVYLLNVPRLDRVAIESLEAYARAGGGVCFFMGDACSFDFYNERLYREGKGLFPARLLGPVTLFSEDGEPRADIEPTDHPAFKPFTSVRNSFLSSVMLERYYGVDRDWKPEAASAVRVIAAVRNGAPLALDMPFGKGRVVAMLTSAGPSWNNWSRNPSFVLMTHELQSYLSQRPGADSPRLVGSPIAESLPEADYRRQVKFTAPEPRARDKQRPPVEFDLQRNDRGLLDATFRDIDHAGHYELALFTAENKPETRQYAVNVDTVESDLDKPSLETLDRSLAGLPHDLRPVETFETVAAEVKGSQLSTWIQYLLIAILLGEQFLAYVASYHPARGASV